MAKDIKPKDKDNYYNKIDYYESRHLFISNEPINDGLKVYNEDLLKNEMWEKINNINKEEQGFSLQENLPIKSDKILDLTSKEKIGCKKCGYSNVLNLVGHLTYQCYNTKKEVSAKDRSKEKIIEQINAMDENLIKLLKQKRKKQKENEKNIKIDQKESKVMKEKYKNAFDNIVDELLEKLDNQDRSKSK